MMPIFFRKPLRRAVLCAVLLIGLSSYALLRVFVLSGTGAASTVTPPASTQDASGQQLPFSRADPIVSDTSYEDENIRIRIDTAREYDTDLYVADIQLASPDYLRTAFAKSTYGRNIRDTTSDIAAANSAIFAVNGDSYGSRSAGFVLRNGILYRDAARAAGEDLVIDGSGNFSIVNEDYASAQSLAESGAQQIFSLGPALVSNGQVCLTQDGSSGSRSSRTAIGQISALHYLVIVSDGRTSDSAGLSLLQLAQEFQARGCTVAYSLGGGDSSAMWFNGKLLNHPAGQNSDTGSSVSDILYFGY